jgi:hypothetical protein
MNKGIIGFIQRKTTTRPSQCGRCIHYLGGMSCKAFPDKNIPFEIFREKVKHKLIIGNQRGNYIYTPQEKFIAEDKKYEAIEKEAISEIENNKQRLPLIIKKMIQREGGNFELIKKIEVETSGSLRINFKCLIKFFPKEEAIFIDISKSESVRIAAKIIRALEGLNLEPKFKLTLFDNGEYKYE